MALDRLARPVDAILRDLKKVRADYREAQRKEVVDLVAKVARQVIRAELALQPVQLLALVDETLASMPPTREEIDASSIRKNSNASANSIRSAPSAGT